LIRQAMWVVAASFLAAATLTAQAKLSTQWEELTAGDFRQGIQQSKAHACFRSGFWKSTGRIFRWEPIC